MKNSFTFLIDGKQITAHNTVKNAFEHWANRYAFAAYIAVMGEGKRLDKEAELVSYNDNVNKGKLYATYRIKISNQEFPHKITSVGFAPYPNAELSNECSVEVSAQTEIYGTVYLEVVGSDFTFYPGENPLVQSLLGMRPFASLTVKASDAKLTGRPAAVDANDYVDVNSLVYMDGQRLNVQFDSQGFSDFLLTWDDKPCARFNVAYFAAQSAAEKQVVLGGVYVDGAIQISNFVFGDKPRHFEYFDCVSRLYDSAASSLSGWEGYELFCDPLYKHAGLKNGSEYYVVDTVNFCVTRGGSYEGELFMCSNGEVVSVMDGKVQFLNSGQRTSVEIGQTVVNYNDGGYDIFVYAQGTLFTYRYDTQLSLISVLAVASGGQLTCANDYSVIIRSGNQYLVYTVDGLLPIGNGRLTGMDGERAERGCFYGDGYMGCYVNSKRINCDKASGRFCLSGGALYYVGEGEICLLREDFSFDSAAVASGVALFVQGDKLHFYLTASSGVYLSAFVAGQASYDVKRFATAGGNVTLRIQD